MQSFQIIKSPSGEEMVVIPKSEFDDMVARLADLVEDAADVAVYDARKADLAGQSELPPEVSLAILRGDSRLKAIRKFRGLSQVDLANAASLGQGYLSDMESGRRSLSATATHNLSRVLEVPAEWLEG